MDRTKILKNELLIHEASNIIPHVKNWIYNGCARKYRTLLKTYFNDDEIIKTKITEILFLLSYLTNIDSHSGGNGSIKTRHKHINLIQNKILTELSFEHTWRFVEIIVDASQYFCLNESGDDNSGTYKRQVFYSCNIPNDILNDISVQSYKSFFPSPLTEQPVDWKYENNTISGGYQHIQYEMIRSHVRDIDYSLYSKNVFDSINYIQSTAWCINESVLMRIEQDLVEPRYNDFVKFNKPDNKSCKLEIDLNDSSLKISESERAKIKDNRKIYLQSLELYKAYYNQYESALSNYRTHKLAIKLAKKYIDKTIYFPHSYDSRGRIYPIPSILSPQGTDAIKAMLEYAQGEQLTKNGENWCWAYLASLYGDDKLPFTHRVQRGKEMLNTSYKQADKPYQFLSHQIEMQNFINDSNYKIKTRIHLDACNSGSQFTSAITGDIAGCEATNVIPTFDKNGNQKREDIYIRIAETSIDLIDDELNELKFKMNMKNEFQHEDKIEKLEILMKLLETNGRSICKTPVMISNYGGTTIGMSDLIWKSIIQNNIDTHWITKESALHLSRIIGEAIYGELNGGKAFEKYIQEMNSILTKSNKAISWKTSDGFMVNHVKYKEASKKQITLKLPNSEKQINIFQKDRSSIIDSKKMRRAISPNFIHSLDADLLRRVALRLRNNNIKSSDWIHDSFGCHPNHVDKMLVIIKKEFIALIKTNPIEFLHEQLISQLDDSTAQVKKIDKIKLPYQNDNKNTIEIKLDLMKKNEYFFS
ncbi:hypothetical protein DWB61_02035 [Ancylomarina euxinus]|uniref:DNA-directed RNA polymerase n=1 Tax=Ancylomarina euxinus TaxID=2283627 RepID=A0A425Y8G6_9BACT|nr:DNA-directed RNA polymerase [Ancylomarina euxinus]MCZ4693312.1 hypothetical protein [Ancylomarina euxinus]MUP13540.1 hypothetical protein [Ancylomarina euxinus]RRG24811.1 hypothetical protein DWB61_02035 [Ancylomarina euxinus]